MLNLACEIFFRSPRPRIVVIGDAILDINYYGSVEPNLETVSPKFVQERQEQVLGGALHTAQLLAVLGAEVTPVSVIAEDTAGRVILQQLEDIDLPTGFIYLVNSTPTTVKARYYAHNQRNSYQQIFRTDQDGFIDPDVITPERLVELSDLFEKMDLVVFSDYGKGLFTEDRTPQLIELAHKAGCKVLVDPKCQGSHDTRFEKADYLKPNRTALSQYLGVESTTYSQVAKNTRELLKACPHISDIICTADSLGLHWGYHSQDCGKHISSASFPTLTKRIDGDVIGSGDVVCAILAYGIAQGCSMHNVITLAQAAAALSLQQLGSITISPVELILYASTDNVIDTGNLPYLFPALKQHYQSVVMTNGCFDLLHPGHIDLLRQAKLKGDFLVVGVNSDKSVTQLKGEGRPVIPIEDRVASIQALGLVDLIFVYDEPSVEKYVEIIKPDVLVKGAGYTTCEEVVGHTHANTISIVPAYKDYSTTTLKGD